MSYLLDFVKSFDESELKQFRQLDLVGKEELLRDEYANHAQTKDFTEENLILKYQLTQSHFDKINSVLLDKTITKFYGDDFNLVLSKLLAKGLSQLMWHELKILERGTLKQGNKTLHTKFYQAAFENLSRMYHPHYNSKLTHGYGKKFLQALGEKATIADKTFVALYIHLADMLEQSVAGNEEKYRATAFAVLEKWRKKLEKTKSSVAHFYYHYAFATYIKYYGSEIEAFILAHEKGLELLNICEKKLNERFRLRVLCELGFGYMEGNNFERAEYYYKQALELPSNYAGGSSYHTTSYLYACLLNKNVKQAEMVFEKHLSPFLKQGLNRSMQFDVLVAAYVVHLHAQKLEKAFSYLETIRAYGRNELTRQGHIMIRVCETLYFYCLADYQLSETIASKNLRFLNRTENKTEQFDYHRKLFDCILKLSRQKQKGNSIPLELQQQIKSLKGGLYGIFNQLL